MAKRNGKPKSFWVDDETANDMDEFSEINFSEVARRAVSERIRIEKKIVEKMSRGF